MALSCHLMGVLFNRKAGLIAIRGNLLRIRYAVQTVKATVLYAARDRQYYLTRVEVRPHSRAGSGLSLDWFSRTGMRAEAADDAFRNGVLQEDGGRLPHGVWSTPMLQDHLKRSNTRRVAPAYFAGSSLLRVPG